MKPKGPRADQCLVDLGLVPSRSRGQSLILAGLVFEGERPVKKAAEPIQNPEKLFIKQKEHPYVGRGGMKLAAALDHFNIPVQDTICIDVGASTGGFTDCLLQRGAKKVYAVDVGTNQLDWKIRQDSRVVVMEQTNFRNMDLSVFTEPFDPSKNSAPLGRHRKGFSRDEAQEQAPESGIHLMVMDVSFISITLLLPQVGILKPKRIVCLVKPQFEVGKDEVGKKGIVREPEKHAASVLKVRTALDALGYQTEDCLPSPILGQTGNHEFLLYGKLN